MHKPSELWHFNDFILDQETRGDNDNITSWWSQRRNGDGPGVALAALRNQKAEWGLGRTKHRKAEAWCNQKVNPSSHAKKKIIQYWAELMKAGTKRMHFYSTLILQGKELKGQVLTSANKTSTNRSKRGKL